MPRLARGAAQLLEPGLKDEDRALTQLICAETDRIRNLVDRMEVFGDERPIAAEPVNIHVVLDHVKRLSETGFGKGVRIQAEFVDNPVAAVTRANALITEVMRARGYPVERFEQRVQDLTVAHPGVVQHYRAAHELSLSVNNEANATENLRQAVVHYRALFAELLQGAPDTVEWERAHA